MLDLRGISSFTDFFVICSGDSDPQLKAISSSIADKAWDTAGIKPFATEGRPASQWIVMDFMQVIVHIFNVNTRDFYGLEELWNDAPRIDVGA